jgi:uncharacterized Zn finger protein
VSQSRTGWESYVPVAKRRKRAERAVKSLGKKGQSLSPVQITGRRIAITFWGKAWCDNLESYQDFANRLPRGRTYVRNGSVLDLKIAPCEIRALVSGSSIYNVAIKIGALPKAQWQATCSDCAGGIDSLVELLQGRFSKGVMERVCQQGKGLFPKPSEIEFSCSCPDYASMCKHIAAVLYGVGARLDQQPELLFQLRAVNQNELVTKLDGALPLSKTTPDAARLLVDGDVSALFGLEMEGELPAVPMLNTPAPRKENAASRRRTTSKSGTPGTVALNKVTARYRSPQRRRKNEGKGRTGATGRVNLDGS